jgi:phospholipase C
MPNSLNLIENIVVVMLENRSFDNILGSLYPNSPQFEGLKLDGSMYNVWNNTKYPVTNNSSTSPFVTPSPDPGESFTDMTLQLFNTTDPPAGATANMAGFVNDWMADQNTGIPTNKECLIAPSWPSLPRTNPSPSPGDIMFYFTPSQLSVTSLLAQAFAVSDAWFGSCPTQTYPNRFFLNSASSGGYVNDVDYLCHLEIFPNLPTIFELLDGGNGHNPANWKVYFHDFPISKLNEYVFLSDFAHNVCNFDTSDYGFLSKHPTFAEDVQNRTLPRYSFIEPRYGGINHLPPNDNHPPYDVRNGEILVGTIYNLLRGSTYYWPRTLFIITYDEHGGCFDHVIPPAATIPGGDQFRDPSTFPFNRFGPRVPAILVSPYIAAKSVIRPAGFSYVQGSGTSTTNGVIPFDHTSVIRTLVECFNLNGGNAYLTARDKNAPSMAAALTLGSSNMNNGPASVQLPTAEPLPAGTVPESALAEIYKLMNEHLGTPS